MSQMQGARKFTSETYWNVRRNEGICEQRGRWAFFNSPMLSCLLPLASCLLLMACQPLKPETAVAKVNAQSITIADLERRYRMMELTTLYRAPQNAADAHEMKLTIVEELILHRLFLTEALKAQGGVGPEEEQNYLQNLRHGYDTLHFRQQLEKLNLTLFEWEREQREKFRIQQWIAQAVGKENPLSENELKNYYQKRQEQFREPEKVRARHIIVSTRNEAEDLRRRLKSGENFADLARQYSTGPEAIYGGDLGYFSRIDYPPEFTKTCFALKNGEYSAVIPSDYGFHLFAVLDREPASLRPYDAVKEEIRYTLIKQRAQAWTEQQKKHLREAAKIEILHDVLQQVNL